MINLHQYNKPPKGKRLGKKKRKFKKWRDDNMTVKITAIYRSQVSVLSFLLTSPVWKNQSLRQFFQIDFPGPQSPSLYIHAIVIQNPHPPFNLFLLKILNVNWHLSQTSLQSHVRFDGFYSFASLCLRREHGRSWAAQPHLSWKGFLVISLMIKYELECWVFSCPVSREPNRFEENLKLCILLILLLGFTA